MNYKAFANKNDSGDAILPVLSPNGGRGPSMEGLHNNPAQLLSDRGSVHQYFIETYNV